MSLELFSKDAEDAVIGAVLIDQSVLFGITLDPEDFYIHRNRFVWEAVRNLDLKGQAIDFITVTDELERIGKLAEVGGAAYLAELINATVTTMHAEEYAGIVKDRSKRRQWLRLAQEIAKAAGDLDVDLDAKAGQFVDRMVRSSRSSGGAVHISHFNHRLARQVDERCKDPRDIWGIPTGFTDLDKLTGGLQKGEVLVLTADPGIGKSTLAVQIGFQAASGCGPDMKPIPNIPHEQHPGAIYSLEMVGEQVVRRIASFYSKVPASLLKSGRLTDYQRQDFLKALAYMDELPVYMSDEVHWTTTSLRADIARMKTMYGIEWFIVDYLFLMQDGGGKLTETELTNVVSRNLKGIAKDLGVAGLIIHSKNKAGEMRGSKQVSFDGDVIIDMEPEKNIPNVVNCVVRKGRDIEDSRKIFSLVRKTGFPAFDNAMVRKVDLNLSGSANNGRFA